MSSVVLFLVGFLAQAFFSARILVQWILSEKKKQVVSPTLFWVLSVLGSYLLFLYGWLRDDFAIILGQVIAYYIYLWNLKEKGLWTRLPLVVRSVLVLTPLAAGAWIAVDFNQFVRSFFHNEAVPLWLLVFGSAGQVIFTLRFIYQWYYSYRRHESLLPIGFWVTSLVGSATIIAYALFRLDPVLILGQSVGFVAYSRNIMIGLKEKQV